MIPVTPWVERKFDFHFPVGLFPIILELLRGTIPRLQSMMSNTRTHEACHNNKSIDELLKQFADKRQTLLSRVIDIDDRMASRIALHPRLQKSMRLVDSLFFAAEHDDHELTKIRGLVDR